MITRKQWEAMTAQQQFDYVCMLEETVDAAIPEEPESCIVGTSWDAAAEYAVSLVSAEAEATS